MAVIKPKDMFPFGVLSIFGQSHNNYQHSEQIFRLLMEIEFKWKAAWKVENFRVFGVGGFRGCRGCFLSRLLFKLYLESGI